MDGFIASAVAVSLTHPIEVFKIRAQTGAPFKLANLYAGIRPQLYSQPIFYGAFFAISKKEKEIPNSILRATVATGVASLVANPFFVLKTRLQAYKNTTLATMVKTEGPRVLLSGFGLSLCNNTKLLIQFPLMWQMEKDNYNTTIASATGKLVANTLFYPTEILRTVVRNNGPGVSLIETIKSIHPHYYRGFLWYNLLSVTNFVLIMNIIELLKKLNPNDKMDE